MMKILALLLRRDDGLMTIAQDEYQALYTDGSVWETCLPEMKRHDLHCNHRNSVQIAAMSVTGWD